MLRAALSAGSKKDSGMSAAALKHLAKAVNATHKGHGKQDARSVGSASTEGAKRGPGRPKGSKNKVPAKGKGAKGSAKGSAKPPKKVPAGGKTCTKGMALMPVLKALLSQMAGCK